MLFRIGLAGGKHTTIHHRRNLVERDCNLAQGDLYVFPNASSVIDATQPLTFKWNPTCPLSSTTIDLYLYDSNSTSGLIHAWTGVPYSPGQYTANLLPKWWNDTTTASLQMTIIDSGAPSWDTASPAGPVFTVNYARESMVTTLSQNGAVTVSTAAAAVTQSADAIFQNVSSNNAGHHGPSKGAIAAAVIVPLLVLAGIAAAAVRFWRQRENEKRKRWSHALSHHSNLEWEKGALPGEKPPSVFGGPGGRASSQFSRPMSHLTQNRPTSSVFAVEGNFAGAGAFPRPGMGMRSASSDALGQHGNNSRSSIVLPDGNVRQSRISFAENARPDRRSRLSLGSNGPSGVWRMPGGSRSAQDLITPNKRSVYATGSAIADDNEEIQVSPSQVNGPYGFEEADMRRAGGQKNGRRSIMSVGSRRRESDGGASAVSADDFKAAASARGSMDALRDMEAVTLMRQSIMAQRTGGSTTSLPETAQQGQSQAVESLAPTSADGPANPQLGPDQMLAVYAARAKTSGATSPVPDQAAPSLQVPKPVATRQNSNPGLRLLAGLKRKDKEDRDREMMPPPASTGNAAGGMRSFVHLNTGSVPASAIHGNKDDSDVGTAQ